MDRGDPAPPAGVPDRPGTPDSGHVGDKSLQYGAAVSQAITEGRTCKGLSLEDLSGLTRLRMGILSAVEAGDMSAFGGDAYARAHLRAIAGLLDLDPDAIVSLYEASL